jgi:hypothetical protein
VPRRMNTTGLLVVKVWREEGSASPLRAQVRYMAEVSSGVEVTKTFTDTDAALEAVRAWLTELATAP